MLQYLHQRSATVRRLAWNRDGYAADRRNLAESIAELREIESGRDDILAEAAGIQAGSWYAWPASHAGYELVAAGMLILAGVHDGKTDGLSGAGAMDQSRL